MITYLTRQEINKISEGLLEVFYRTTNNPIYDYIDIESFLKSFLKLNIVYVNFAGDDIDKMGFLSNGKTKIKIKIKGKEIENVFPKNTIVIDKFLLNKKEEGRYRFTLAHEGAHYILTRMEKSKDDDLFYSEFDDEREYSLDELRRMFSSCEWQADTMAASLLMPIDLVKRVKSKVTLPDKIKVYGGSVISQGDKVKIKKAAQIMKVSYKALLIRMKDLGMFEYREISEYIENELHIGG